MAVPEREEQVERGPPPERWFTFFGLVIVRRADLLAAAAFVLSLSTILYQLTQFIRGANPEIYHPDTVYVYFDQFANNVVATRFAGQVSFTNSGDAGRNSIVREVSASMEIGNKVVEEGWLSFSVVTRDETKLVFDIKETAHPFVINGGGASSYMMTFSPRVKDCPELGNSLSCIANADLVSDTDFLNLLSVNTTITFKFIGAIFDSNRPLHSTCTSKINSDMLRTMAKNNWYAMRCASSERQ